MCTSILHGLAEGVNKQRETSMSENLPHLSKPQATVLHDIPAGARIYIGGIRLFAQFAIHQTFRSAHVTVKTISPGNTSKDSERASSST